MNKTRYKKRRCANPDCPDGEFQPSRADQVHCSEACRLRKNYVANKPELDRMRAQEIRFKKADKALKRLYQQMLKTKSDRVSRELFYYENIDPTLRAIARENPITRRPIHFIYNYGYEYDGNGYYLIHKMREP